jgi:plasmid replication initiation protein
MPKKHGRVTLHTEENMTEVQLFKPNEMVSFFAQLELNRTARHLFNYFLQHAQRKIKFENYQDDTFHINIKELNELAQIYPKTYEIVEKSLRCLMRPVVIRNDPHCYEAFVPVTRVKVNKKTGEYDFTLQRLVIDLLRQTDYFTKLNLKEFNPFNSKFSLIILEFLKQYEKLKNIPEVSIDELRKITDTQNKYSIFTAFKNKVLDVAVSEINEFTNYNVSYELVTKYTSRRPKVSAVQFYFSKKVLEATNSPTVEEAACSESDPLWVQEPVQEVQELTVDEAFGLFAELKRVFTDLSREQYNLATYKYTYKTLNKFAENIAKYTKTYTSNEFEQWLADRTQKLDFYNERAMSFEMIDVLNSFIANPQYKLQDQDGVQVRALVGAYGTLEYKDYVPRLAELYNMCFPQNTYNPFEKMLERMQ